MRALLLVLSAAGSLSRLDMYASVFGESAKIDKLLRRLQRVVRAECGAQQELSRTLGVLDALFAVHTVQ